MNDAFWDFVTEEVWPVVRSLFGAAVHNKNTDKDDDDGNRSLCLFDAGSAFMFQYEN